MTREAIEKAQVMAATTPAMRQITALGEIADVVGRIDPEATQTLAQLSRHGVPPNTQREPDRFAAFLAESVSALAKAVEEGSKPRPRGRPAKTS